MLEEINAINKLFKETYHLDRNNKLDDAFLDCYETTASKCYEKLIALAKEYPERNSLVFGSVMVAILLSYQALLDKGEDIKLKVFTEYTEEVNVRYFGYCDVMRWFRRRTNFTAAYNTIELIKEYTS